MATEEEHRRNMDKQQEEYTKLVGLDTIIYSLVYDHGFDRDDLIDRVNDKITEATDDMIHEMGVNPETLEDDVDGL